jgi:MFS family permease
VPSISLQRTIDSKKILIALFAAAVSFLTYASVYAYRKPFTVAEFNGLQYGGISYQSLLIICQVTGYMISKFFGIKFIAELKRRGRWKAGAVLLGTAWISLLFFAIIPAPYALVCLVINGFALGFMWGIVFSYVEGRRTTDFIGAVMAVSFIFAGGFTRSVAKWLMLEYGITENWMPFATGAIFALPLVFFIYLLEKIPPPDEDDMQNRAIRLPMNREQRGQFLKKFSLGIVIITAVYMLLTIMRDVRDNFMANMWAELGYGGNYRIFTKTEITISVIVLLMMALLVTVRRNMQAFQIIHVLVLAGFITACLSSVFFFNGELNGAVWMQLTGLGLYMAYIPFNCLFFERLIAVFKTSGNAGFLMYFIDAFGYLASTAIIVIKELMRVDRNWVSFFSGGVIVFSAMGMAGIIVSLIYFNKKYKQFNRRYE